jgi:AcrR family transcriptional regulator
MNETSVPFCAPKRLREEAPTAKGRNTEARIREAGRTVIEERGYFDASVTEITERSDVALGTFYRYFENKDVLFLQLLETLVTDLYDSVSGSWGKEDEMKNLRDSSLRYLTAYYANRKLIAAMIQMSGAVPACAALWWALRKRTYDQMKRYLATSKIARELDPELTATALGSMVEQFAYYWYVEAERNGKPMPRLEEAADVLSRVWYRAVYETHSAKTEKRKS